ncbi:helix-turn-helix transcriptional regulator [Ligilactobacillus equi]
MENYVKENLYKLLKVRGITQCKLADDAQISRQTVHKLLSRTVDYNPKLSTLVAVTNILEIDLPLIFNRWDKIPISGSFSPHTVDFYLEKISHIIKKFTEKEAHTQFQLTVPESIRQSTIINLISKKYPDTYLSTIEKLAKNIDITINELLK